MLNLEEESKKIDFLIKKDVFVIILASLLVIVYFGGIFLIKSFFNENKYWAIWLGVLFLIVVGILLLNKGIGDRKLLAYSLYKISEGIRNKKLEDKYVLFLNRNWVADKEKKIIKNEPVFEHELLKETRFDENILRILRKLSYAKNHGNLDRFNPDDFEKLARDILYQNRGIIELSYKINKQVSEEEPLPTNFRKMASSDIFRFIFVFLLLVIIFFLCYRFIIPDKSTIFISFWGVAGVAAYIIFKRK